MIGTKIVENYCYEGFGFPVYLTDVEMIKIDNKWHPKIDVRKVADDTFEVLSKRKDDLTYTELVFLRVYFHSSPVIKEVLKELLGKVEENPASFECGYCMGYKTALLDFKRL